MLAANYDITIDRATDYSFVVTITNQLGEAVDLTSVAAGTPDLIYAHIRDSVTKKLVVSFTTTVVGDPTDGQISLALSEDDTLLLNAVDQYEYDLFMAVGSRMLRLLYGTVTARANATKVVPVEPTS